MRQKTGWDKIKTLVFDLDGTLYHDSLFYLDYLHFLLEGSDWENSYDALCRYAQEVLEGKHLKLNGTYCSRRLQPNTIEELFSQLETLYVENPTWEQLINNQHLIYLGDMWYVLRLIGEALGLLDGERSQEVYLKTRDQMVKRGLHIAPQLRKVITELAKQRRVVLLTNSPHDTAIHFLRTLQCEHLFSHTITHAGKPVGMEKALRETFGDDFLDAPETVLSIGDHMFNDLMPLQNYGCKTLWINNFNVDIDANCDYMIHGPVELTDFLEQLCASAV